jgi:hypothetical protein
MKPTRYKILFSTGEGPKPNKGIVTFGGLTSDDGSIPVRIILDNGQVIDTDAQEVDE